MKAPIKNLDHFGLLCSLSVVVLTSLVGLMGIFRQPNEQINDALLSFGPAESNTNQVLLIPTSSDVFDQKDCRTLNRIVAALDGLAPRAIGLSFVPDAEQLSAIRNWKRNCPIVIGEDPQQTRVANQSQFVASSSRPIEFGRLDRKLDQRVYREHFATIATQQGPADSLAKRLAAIGTKSDSIASETFGIRYVGGPNSLPHVGADDVLEGNIIREMVEGRTVLIGPNEPVEIGLPTPVTRGPQRMSYLEVQGNAVHTLLTQGVVSHSDAWLSVTVLILLTVSSCQLFRQIPTRWLIAALVYTLLSVGLIGCLFLHLLAIKLPLAAGMFAVTSMMLACVKTRFQSFGELVDNWQLLRQTRTHSDWRSEEKDTWTLLSDSIYQIFSPNRVVLMELTPGATHLRVTKTIHCLEKDILERRRDFNREPYRNAVELGAAMKIAHRQFFNVEEDSDCFEYIAPLMVLSELVGFMVLEMDREAVRNWDDFENFLTQFASDMAVLVNKYQLLQQQETSDWNLCHNLKELPEDHRKRNLFQREVEHFNLEKLLGDAFETIQTAGAICDVFGRVIRTNRKMVELLQANGISIDETDCVTLLKSMTGWEKDDCRRLFRQCIVEGQTQQIFLPQDTSLSAPRVLYLEPLKKGGDDSHLATRCACIQIVEGRIFLESNSWQQEFLRHNIERATRELNILRERTVQLSLGREDDFPMLEERTASDILQAIAECQALLSSQFSEEPDDVVLVKASSIWESCWQRMRPKLEARCVTLTTRFDAADHVVAANPFLLDRIFETLIDCVSQDIGEEAEIIVSSDDVDGKHVFRISDIGGSAPLDELRKSLDLGQAERSSEHELLLAVLHPAQVDKLREINAWLTLWQGSMTIHCGENYRVSFELILNSELPETIDILEQTRAIIPPTLPSLESSKG